MSASHPDPVAGAASTEAVDQVAACIGCRGLVPQVGGPTHPYMQASPGCWQVYGQLSARWQSEPVSGPAHWHHVDAYAVQHPGGAEHDRRQRQSVAVHLVSLCLFLEHAQPAHQASARRGRTGRVVLPRTTMDDWPHLEPPADLGAVTVADVHRATTARQQEACAQAWLDSAWAAWAAHHDTVRTWASILLEQGS